MNSVDPDAILDRELRRLPVPRAPHTLLPRVLSAVQEWSRRPWYAREWLTWPLGLQVASVAVLVLMIGAAAILLQGVQGLVSGVAPSLSAGGALNHIAMAAERADATMNAARLVWRALLEPVAPYVVALVVLMSAASIAFGTALTSVVSQRDFQL